jgi:hypothetical protein
LADDSFPPGESRDIDENDTDDEHLKRPKVRSHFRFSTLLANDLFPTGKRSRDIDDSDTDDAPLHVALPGRAIISEEVVVALGAAARSHASTASDVTGEALPALRYPLSSK